MAKFKKGKNIQDGPLKLFTRSLHSMPFFVVVFLFVFLLIFLSRTEITYILVLIYNDLLAQGTVTDDWRQE